MAGDGPIVEELGLDVQPALDALEPIGAALSSIAEDFATSLGTALEGLTTTSVALPTDALIDPQAITGAVETAIGEVVAPPIDVPVDGDATGLDLAIADALDAPRPPIEVDGDTTPLSSAIDEATSIPPPIIPVDADVTPAVEAIAGIVPQPADLPVVADTSDAESQITALGETSSSSADNVDALGTAVDALHVSTDAAKGSTGELVGVISNISPEFAKGAAAGVAFAAFLGEVTTLAADAEAQTKRFDDVFGPLSESIRKIDVGGLTKDLGDLATESGTTTADLEAAASRIGQLGKSSSASGNQIQDTTQQVLALGATLSVQNPRLGDAATVTERLTTVLARGGRSASQLGLSLQAADITKRAQEIAGAGHEITQFDRVTAGAQLVVEQFGDTLGTKFKDGSQNAQIQLRALKVEIEETLVAVGGPLLEPLISSLHDAIPVAVALGEALGALARAVLPLVAAIAPALGPIAGALGLVADGLDAIGPPGIAVAAVLAILIPDLVLASAGFGSATVTATAFGTALDFATGPIGITLGLLGAIGAAARLFGGDEKAVSEAAKSAGDAMFDATGDARLFAAGITSAADGFDRFIKSQIDAGKTGILPGVLATTGQTISDLTQHLTIGTDEWNRYKQAQEDAFAPDHVGVGLIVANAVGDSLEKQRKTLIETAKSKLSTLVIDEQLTQAEIAQIEQQDKNSDGTINYGKVLDDVNKKIVANALAQAKATQASADYPDRVREVSKAVLAGTKTTADAADVALQLGISQQDATTFINDLTGAVTNQNDKMILATPAATRLAEQFATGHLSAQGYETALASLKVSVGGIHGAFTEGQAALDDYAQAEQSAKDRAIEATPAARDLRLELQLGNISAKEAEKGFIALGISVGGTQKFLSDAQGAISSYVQSVDSALPTAKDALNDYASTVKQDFQDVTNAAKSHEGSVKTLFDKLTADSNPAKFTENLQKTAEEIRTFGVHLAAIATVAPELAHFLGTQGPILAGGIATMFAGDPAQAAAAESGLKLVDLYTDSINKQVGVNESKFERTGGVIGDALTAGVHRFHVDLLTPLTPQLAAVADALARDPAVTQAAGQKALDVIRVWGAGLTFEQAVHRALEVAKAGIDADTGVGTAAELKAVAASERFHPDFAGRISTNINAAAAALAADPTVSQAAGEKGLAAVSSFHGNLTLAQAVHRALAAAHAAMLGDDSIPNAAGQVGNRATDRFHPEFGGRVRVAQQAAAVALENDPAISQAAGRKGLAVLAAFEAAYGPTDTSTAVKVALGGAHDALDRDSTLAVKGGQKGKQTTDAFKRELKIKEGAATKFDEAVTTILNISNIPNVAGLLGVRTGEAFGQGLANGIDEKNPDIVAAAQRAMAAADKAARAQAGITSPSKVAAEIGGFFSAGLALGITSGAVGAIDATQDLADQVIKRLRDQLNAGIARASATQAAQSALGQFVTSAVGQLPDAGAAISTFTQGVTSAASNQKSALETYHKAYAQFRADQADLNRTLAAGSVFQRELAAANLRVAQANAKLQADTASNNTGAIEADQRALDSAQTRVQSLNERLNNQRRKIAEDRAAIGQGEKDVRAAEKASAAASDPDAFARNLNRQNAKARRFTADLRKLVGEGFVDLAKQLAAAGVENAGKLADGLASDKAAARSANAAIKQAAKFQAAYQQTLEKLFGSTASVGAATTAGVGVGVGIGQGIAAGANSVPITITTPVKFDPTAKIGTLAPISVDVIPHLAPLPPLAPITVEVIPQLTVPLTATGPIAGAAPAVAGSGVQNLNLDLTVVLESGAVVKGTVTVPVAPAGSDKSLTQMVHAEVHAS